MDENQKPARIKATLEFSVTGSGLEEALVEYDELTVEGMLREMLASLKLKDQRCHKQQARQDYEDHALRTQLSEGVTPHDLDIWIDTAVRLNNRRGAAKVDNEELIEHTIAAFPDSLHTKIDEAAEKGDRANIDPACRPQKTVGRQGLRACIEIADYELGHVRCEGGFIKDRA